MQSKSSQPRKRFVGFQGNPMDPNNGSSLVSTPIKKRSLTVPEEILTDPHLKEMISHIPSNYNFEIYKSIWQIMKNKAKIVALQFPEGLLMYSLLLADLFQEYCQVETIIMGDVTYGACCIDDYTAKALGADFMIHYGHSCLVPISETSIKTMYVFVDIGIDTDHLVDTVLKNLPMETRLGLVGTIQFASSLQITKQRLQQHGYTVVVPQSKPLSPGEVLGCTSPKLTNVDIILFIGDGRFHLESIMISNPSLPAYKYDPYSKVFSIEEYSHSRMQDQRRKAIQVASGAKSFGLILGTLGRQGSPKVLKTIQEQLESQNLSYNLVLLSEIFPSKLDLFTGIDAWIQIACPRLSIDWGYSFSKPLLSPYESAVALKKIGFWETEYPMDFYAKDSLGPWTPHHVPKK